MYYDTIMAGFGGQGIQTISLLVAVAAINKGLEVTYLPSYGVEKRGGRTNVIMVISDEEIGAPIINHPQCVIALDSIALTSYQESIIEGGTLLYNSSLIQCAQVTRKDITAIPLACNEEALHVGNAKLANMVALGGYIALIDFVNLNDIISSMDEVIPNHLKKHIPSYITSIQRGMEITSAFLKKNNPMNTRTPD
ncbi:MAG: 2-oxoacid:acceptor oxidoreductase family protein [Spirochaetes bacterium]|nr:2-oxoacid:acceptor oxidoreductase family protein [Spirochaetota bacterium]